MTAEGCATFSVETAGTEPMSYVWTHDGRERPNRDGPFFDVRSVRLEDAGIYEVSVRNNYGQAISQGARLQVLPTYPLDLALGSNGWSWENWCNERAWFGQTNVTHAGAPAAQSGAGAGQIATLITALTGPGTLTFSWRLQADSTQDLLRIYCDGGQERRCDPANPDWQESAVWLGTGYQSLRWQHFDASTSSTAGAWVSSVHWVPGGVAPMIWQHPVALTGVETGSARVQVQADGTPPLHYAWRHDSEVVPAATGDLLELRTLGSMTQGLRGSHLE